MLRALKCQRMAIFINVVCSGLQISDWPVLALRSMCIWYLAKTECMHVCLSSKGMHAAQTCCFSLENCFSTSSGEAGFGLSVL